MQPPANQVGQEEQASPQIPPVEVPAIDTAAAKEAEGDFGAKALDVSVKRVAAYGALSVALVLYGIGAVIVWKAMSGLDCAISTKVSSSGSVVDWCPAQIGPESWHPFVGALVALFSVPTVLVITVLRAVASSKKDPGADSVYAAIGEKLVSVIEKFAKSDKD